MANTRDRNEKKEVWNAVTLSLKSRLSTCAAMSSSCGCAYHAVAVAAPEMKKNLARLCRLRTGDQADILRGQVKVTQAHFQCSDNHVVKCFLRTSLMPALAAIIANPGNSKVSIFRNYLHMAQATHDRICVRQALTVQSCCSC